MLDSGGDAFYNRAKLGTDNRQECIASDISGWDVLTDYLQGLGREEFGWGMLLACFLEYISGKRSI